MIFPDFVAEWALESQYLSEIGTEFRISETDLAERPLSSEDLKECFSHQFDLEISTYHLRSRMNLSIKLAAAACAEG